jgi:hypothetical protein
MKDRSALLPEKKEEKKDGATAPPVTIPGTDALQPAVPPTPPVAPEK